MSLRFTIWLCAIAVGVISLTSCQPPTPRIVKVEMPACEVVTSSSARAQDTLGSFDLVERAIHVRDLDGLLAHYKGR